MTENTTANEPEHRYVSTGPVTGIRRCACGAAWTDVHEAQASTPTPTESTGAVEAAAEAILEACYGQELPEAPIDLARAALTAALDGTCEATVYDGDDTDRPCGSSAIVGYRLDHDDVDPWPVCAEHARNLVTLRAHLLGGAA